MVSDPAESSLCVDVTSMSLSCGGVSQFVPNSEGLGKDLAASYNWGEDDNACGSRTDLRYSLTENLLASTGVYGFKGMKRQRLNGDAVCREDLSSFENDAGLLLGLGCMASELNAERRSSLGGRMFEKRFEEELMPMELGLGLTGRAPSGLVERSALTSVDTRVGIPFNTNRDSGAVVNPLLGLGLVQYSFGGATVPDGGRGKDLVAESCNSVENRHSLHDLPASSAILARLDCASGISFGSGSGGPYQDIRSESSRDEYIPVVDEGSTSARTVKCGGYVSSLLMGPKFDSVRSCAGSIGRLGIDLANHVDISEPDLLMNFRSSTGTTSNSGGSADRAPKTCTFKGCGKGARGASALCIAHGGGRRCQKQGCNKGAEGRTVYCKAHGGGRRCESLGCTKSAEGKTDYCIGHGGGRRCIQGGCNKAARGKSGLCIRHGGGKRCQKEGCTKSAEGYSGLCISHGGGRRCQFPDCGKGAQGSTMLCKAHGGGKRCMIQGCSKGAEGSTPLCKGHGGGKRCMFDGGGICTKSVHGATSFCVAHGGGKRCAVQECTKSARGRTDFCVRHGGGRRCKFEHCTKSAQGSTDFCKAHGGGKRCSWGQKDSPYYSRELGQDFEAELFKGPCDRFARGKIGLCAAHSALVQDRRVHGASTIGSALSPGIAPGLFSGLVSGSGSEHKEARDHSISYAMRCGESSSERQMSASLEQEAIGGESADMEDHGQEASISSFWKSKSMNRNGLATLDEPSLPISSNPPQHSRDNSLSSNIVSTLGGSETFRARKTLGDENSVSHLPLIPPCVLVPLSMQKGDSLVPRIKRSAGGHKARLSAADDDTFYTSSLSLPEKRVHGGKIMSVK